MARDPFTLQVHPAEMPVFGRVTPEIELASIGIEEPGVSGLLIFEKEFQLSSQLGGFSLLFDPWRQQRSDGFGGRGR